MYEIDVTGFEELELAMRRLPAAVTARVQGFGCRAMARVVADTARQLVPERTGALKASIRVRRVADRTAVGIRVAGAAAHVIAGGEGARHAHFVELGTSRAMPRPFMARALRSRRAEQHRAFARACERAFARTVRQLATGTAPAVVQRLAAQ